MNTKKSKILCAICGLNEATTSDHVPPKNLFPKPRPNLITVPACLPCNNSASNDDEKLMLYVSLQIGPEESKTRDLWESKAFKSLERNKRFQREFFSQMKLVPLVNESGNKIKDAMTFLAEKSVYDAVFERMVRGLYFYHFKEILGPKVTFEIAPSAFLSDEIFEASKTLTQNEIVLPQLEMENCPC